MEGLDATLSEVLPMADYRYCVQHMYSNKALYEKYLKELKDYDKDAWTWVKNGPKPDHWV